MSERYMKATMVASEYGLTTSLLKHLRFTGKGPIFLKPTPRTVLYRESDVIAWLATTEREISSLDGRPR